MASVVVDGSSMVVVVTDEKNDTSLERVPVEDVLCSVSEAERVTGRHGPALAPAEKKAARATTTTLD